MLDKIKLYIGFKVWNYELENCESGSRHQVKLLAGTNGSEIIKVSELQPTEYATAANSDQAFL